MGLSEGLKKGSPLPFCLQHSQDPSALFSLSLYDRSLLSELSRCTWEALRVFFQEAVPQRGAVAGAVVAI